MNWDFLEYKYLGTDVASYLRFLAILLIALLFKRYISSLFAKIFYKVYKKFWQDFAGQQFKLLIIQPLQGLIVVILFYFAFDQIHHALTKIVLIKRTKIALESGKQITTRLLTLENVVDHLLLFFFIFYFFLLIARFIDYLFLIYIHRAEINKERNKQQVLPLLKDVFKVLIWLGGFFTILGVVFNANVGTLVAGLGISGIAIAFAAKESLENLMASFMLMTDKPFTIGDWIKLGDMEGTVEKIGFRSTRIRSSNKSLLIIPNRNLMVGNIENFSLRGIRRVKNVIKAPKGLSKEALADMVAHLKTAIAKTDHVAGEPSVFLDNLENESINISIVYFIKLDPKMKFELVQQKVNLAIYEILNRER